MPITCSPCTAMACDERTVMVSKGETSTRTQFVPYWQSMLQHQCQSADSGESNGESANMGKSGRQGVCMGGVNESATTYPLLAAIDPVRRRFLVAQEAALCNGNADAVTLKDSRAQARSDTQWGVADILHTTSRLCQVEPARTMFEPGYNQGCVPKTSSRLSQVLTGLHHV